MAVEIKELVIRAVVENTAASTSSAQGGDSPDQQAIIEACVNQVMKILRKQAKR